MAHRSTPQAQLLLQCLLLPIIGITAKVPAIIVFGDSTVDSGNNNGIHTVLKSNFQPYGRDFYGGRPTGRFCNGRLATDFLSEAFGLRPTVPAYLDPAYGIRDFAVGVCFASAGTGLDNTTSDVLSVIPLWKEALYFQDYIRKLTRYMGKAKALRTLRGAIYIVSVGTNDFLENYFLLSGRSSQFTVEQYEDFLVAAAGGFLAEIYRHGARKISFTGLSPIGCLPLERTMNVVGGRGCNEEHNEAARRFDAKLDALFLRLMAELRGFRIVHSKVYDLFLDIYRNPSFYGFENVEVGCCSTGLFEMGYLCNSWNPFTCPDADKFAFWDAFHPTEKMNSFLANYTLKTGLAQFL
uniref:GDSL esterase/lipase At2g42990 n=1 Tax=Anthurium amnicola TaxID=1678845 RepID=A0A1D1XZ97_9ARAE